MSDTASARAVVLVSNRGPISFTLDEQGRPRPRRGAGGLVSGLAPLVVGTDTLWIAAAMSDGDHAVAAEGPTSADGFRVHLLALDPDAFRAAYDVVGNATLWFLHHGLFELARRPRFDSHFSAAWDAYRDVNRSFADAVAEHAPEGAAVLVQDYHLALTGPMLRERRPDLHTVHFTHTPFAGPDLLRVLPSAVEAELLEGMAGFAACGFHTRRWADAFEACCRDVLGAAPRTFVAPLATDPADIRAVAAGPACEAALAELEAQVGEVALIVRVDRIELSKNLLRGFLAYDELLERYPRWRGQVVFGAFIYPSREGLPEYLAYRQEVESLIARINDRWSTPDWSPILASLADDHPRSVAALRRYDVLLVNPVRDGLNLVATEGALVNERDGVVLLSREAGAWAELEGVVRGIHPYDVSGTADAMAAALDASPEARATEAHALRERAGRRTPADWLADQLAASNA